MIDLSELKVKVSEMEYIELNTLFSMVFDIQMLTFQQTY